MAQMVEKTDDTDAVLYVFFKDEDDEPVLDESLPLTATLREVRDANPRGPDDLWIDFLVPSMTRLERIELFSVRELPKAELRYWARLDDINPSVIDRELWRQVASAAEVVLWKWGPRIKKVLGTNGFAVNWGGPQWNHTKSDGGVTFYLDGEIADICFERQYQYREELDAMTLMELSTNASVLCDFVEKMTKEIGSVSGNTGSTKFEFWRPEG